MLRVARYAALALLTAWAVWNLWSRERRQRLDAGLRRAATVISLAFVGIGAAMLYRALAASSGVGQALFMIVVGLSLIIYQRWGG